jgi:hypothetical protein
MDTKTREGWEKTGFIIPVTDLGQINALRVISRTLMQYKNGAQASASDRPRTESRCRGRGTVVRTGDRVRIALDSFLGLLINLGKQEGHAA